MAYEYTVQSMAGYLLFTITGTNYTAEDVLNFSEEIFSIARQKECSRLLLDERQLAMDFDQFDTYYFAENLASRVPAMGLRAAVLASPENIKQHSWTETLFQNRSINYKVFITMEKAIEWLRS